MKNIIQIAADIALRTIATLGEKLSEADRALFIGRVLRDLERQSGRCDRGWFDVQTFPPPANTTVLAYSASYDTPVFAAQWDPTGEDDEPDEDGIHTGLWWDCRTHQHLEPHTHPVTAWRFPPAGPMNPLLTGRLPAGSERPETPDTNTEKAET